MSDRTWDDDALDPRLSGEDAARWALEQLLDGEGASAHEEMLRRHLDQCPECAEEVERVRRMKELVRRSCCEPAPDSLRERIAIEYRRISITVRRGR